MKYILFTSILIMTLSFAQPLFAAFDKKVTVQGLVKSYDKNFVILRTRTGEAKVHRKSIAKKKLLKGDRVAAKIDINELLKLNITN